jgi:hypothetical protein
MNAPHSGDVQTPSVVTQLEETVSWRYIRRQRSGGTGRKDLHTRPLEAIGYDRWRRSDG